MDRTDAISKLTARGEQFELQDITINGNVCKWFVNAPSTLPQMIKESISDQTFYVYKTERYTFNEMYQRASSLAAELIEKYGISPGDRVAIGMRNYPEWPIAFTAITSIGGIVVALNAWWESDELEYGLNHTGTKVAIVDQERLDRIIGNDRLNEMHLISVRSEPEERAQPIEPLLSRKVDMPEVELGPDDDAVILFTSGSTGHPKGSVSTHRNILASLLSWELDLTCMAVLKGRTKSKKNGSKAYTDSTLLGMPLFHVNGLLAVLLASYRKQRKVVAMYKWDPMRAVELVEREKIISFVGTPAMTGDIMLAAQDTGHDVGSLLAVGGGGAARAGSQVKGLDDTFKNAKPGTAWGMTETNSIGTSIVGDDYLSRPSSSGRVSAVLELGVVDDGGNFLPSGERGELLIRGTSVIHKYWERPDSIDDFLEDGWFRTGDIAYIDKEGFLYVVDRLKQIIIRGGENIGCSEVESALAGYPSIIEACVYGVPDERLGEEVAATIYADNQVDVAALQESLKSKLANFKIPKYVRISETPLARIASGKIDKKSIQKEHVLELDTKKT